jgi:hypothetical protein
MWTLQNRARYGRSYLADADGAVIRRFPAKPQPVVRPKRALISWVTAISG